MNRFVYNIFLHTLVAPFLAAYYLPRVVLGKKYRRSLQGKLGRLPAHFIPERLPKPRVWFHAVSVGEVNALGPLVKEFKVLRPAASVIVSTGTETGQDKARESISDVGVSFIYPWIFLPSSTA
jgi:3-deoxy-D-manno-octulosonic-acid transferase